jgi:hypothetical protein
MSEQALTYRAQRGLLDRDEQMGLLVQRVSGSLDGSLFYPMLAGVGYSFNPYVWSRDIDPRAGVLRLVFGLGTRAVEQIEDDYTRIVALNAPDRRPDADQDGGHRYTQRRVDVLDVTENSFRSIDFDEVIQSSRGLPRDLVAVRHAAIPAEHRHRRGAREDIYTLTFDRVLAGSSFIEHMSTALRLLEESYNCPVDVEFTANFCPNNNEHTINLVQCRPLPAKTENPVTQIPTSIEPEKLLLRTTGPVVGHSRSVSVDCIVCVIPAAYGKLALRERYAVARLIGEITRKRASAANKIMLIGPGRWGTSTPNLGVPVSFAEISRVTVLCEIGVVGENFFPDISLGTHFFNDLVETGMLYLGITPRSKEAVFGLPIIRQAPNRLGEVVSRGAASRHIVHVVEAHDFSPSGEVRLVADTLAQSAACWISS